MIETMTTLDIRFDADSEECLRFPVYRRYEGYYEPQPAHIALDCHSGELTVGYFESSKRPVLDSYFEKRRDGIWHFAINPWIHKDDLKTLIDLNKLDFQWILEGDLKNSKIYFHENWNNNLVYQHCINKKMIENFDGWIREDFPIRCQTLEGYVDAILSQDGKNDYYLPDGLTEANSIREAVLDHWEREFYQGKEIPEQGLRILQENHRGQCPERLELRQCIIYQKQRKGYGW